MKKISTIISKRTIKSFVKSFYDIGSFVDIESVHNFSDKFIEVTFLYITYDAI